MCAVPVIDEENPKPEQSQRKGLRKRVSDDKMERGTRIRNTSSDKIKLDVIRDGKLFFFGVCDG